VVPLESLIITVELDRRTSRPPDYEAESHGLAGLMEALAKATGGAGRDSVLHRLAETALVLCRAHSAGVSLLGEDGGREIVRWHAAAGVWAKFLGGSMPRELSPCGTVLERKIPILMEHPERHYPYPFDAPPLAEVLLIPFHCEGKPVGTVWIMAHDQTRRFDAEDQRLMTGLSRFASSAYQQLVAQELRAQLAAQRALEDRLTADLNQLRNRDAALRDAHERLQAELNDSRLLQTISAELIVQDDINTLYEKLLDAVVAVMRSDFATFQMFYPTDNGGALRLLAFRSFSPDAATVWQTVHLGSRSVCSEAWRLGRRIIMPDVAQCDFIAGSNELAMYRQTGIRAIQSTPLLSRTGKQVGVVSTHWRQPHQPTERDLCLLDIMARQAGGLIAHKQAEARIRQILDTLPVGVWRADVTCTHIVGNRAAYEMLRVPQGIHVSVTPSGKVAPELAKMQFLVEGRKLPPEQMPVQRAVFNGESLRHVAHQFVFPDGEVRIIDANVEPLRDQNGSVTGAVAAYMDVTEQKEMEEKLRDNEARLSAEASALDTLNELSSRLWRMRSLHEGLNEMLAATIQLLGADMGNVQILDAECSVLRIASQHGFGQDFLDFFREVSSEDDSACGRALRSGERVVIEDIEADPLYEPLRAVAKAAGYRAVQSTPLIGRDGTPLGMLSTHTRSVHRPGEQDLRRLDLYVRQAADFIERCRTDEALVQADRRKDEFLATLAHELRNPLAPVRNAIQILRLKGPPNPELQWARDVIDRQIQQMTRLIDDLIDISRITRDRLELRKERVELARILHGAVETVRPLLDGSRHELTVTLPADTIYVDADVTRLAQVFSNLLNNAAKYSDPSGRIFLRVERQRTDAVVSVRDAGIGIPKEMLSRVFEMFTQVDCSRERTRSGLGIGLTLVRRLVEMHGGSVTAHSDGIGEGSEFVVRLPLANSCPADEIQPEHEVTPMPSPARRRILVVDDNDDAATSLSMMLSILGYDTRTAGDGVAGLKAVVEFRPDFAVLDISMPEMDGYELARRIREQPCGTDCVLVALTGWGQEEDRRRAREAGFDYHLTKPVDPIAFNKLLAGLSTSEDLR
jgi:signal transduction histidine kinase/CheY-like chemotaxis protein/PAS domain-containing protein